MPLAQPGPTPASPTTARTLLARITRASIITTAIIAIAACSNTSPQASPTIDPSVVIQATPTSPGLPPENAHLTPPHINDYPGITEETEEGAQQATKYFVDSLHFALATGDTEPFALAFDEDACRPCQAKAEQIEKESASGLFSVYSSIEPTRLDYRGEDENGHIVYAEFARTNVIDVRLDEPRPSPSSDVMVVAAHLTFDDGSWSVTDIDSTFR